MSSFTEIKNKENRNVMHTYNRFDLALDHGKGAKLYDTEGKEYIDLTSGIGVNALGHDHPALMQALEEQMHKLLHVSNLYYTEPMADVAEILVNETGLKRVFFSNSGAEANEGAIKCARKYAADHYNPERYKIITLVNSFHGRTIATLEATGQDQFHKNFFPFTDGFDYAIANDIEDLKSKINDQTAAIMMELIQGESGVRPLDLDYVKEVEKLCRENDILLIIDEVQTGIGRTGALFCYQNYGIEPDLVTMAKGLGGGLPFGGFIAGEKTESTMGPGDHGSTFGGNPLAAAGSKAVLHEILSDGFLDEVSRKGDKLMSLLKEIKSDDVLDVRGQGLMIGIQVPEEKVGNLIAQMMDKGLLVLKAGKDTIRLLPPLVITDEEIEQAAAIMKEVLE